MQARDILQDSTDNSSIDKVETSLEWQKYFFQFQDTSDALDPLSYPSFYACESLTLTAELQRKIHAMEIKLVSELVGALSPVNHRGLHQG